MRGRASGLAACATPAIVLALALALVGAASAAPAMRCGRVAAAGGGPPASLPHLTVTVERGPVACVTARRVIHDFASTVSSHASVDGYRCTQSHPSDDERCVKGSHVIEGSYPARRAAAASAGAVTCGEVALAGGREPAKLTRSRGSRSPACTAALAVARTAGSARPDGSCVALPRGWKLEQAPLTPAEDPTGGSLSKHPRWVWRGPAHSALTLSDTRPDGQVLLEPDGC